ncbi:hypothetical protein NC652_034075 [Populus alba x Populus x berolinensis]|nr:hypothetical protein NC652_034075 [Populus alba x Populus x berolinensis]
MVAASSSHPGGKVWTDLFSTNKQSAPCTKLQNFSLNHLTKTCDISSEDILPQFEIWNLCAVGYVSGKRPDYRALNGIISSVWKCEASLTIHASGWLIYRFSCEEDKSSVLRGGPYQVYGRPLILKSMTKFFDFSTEEMTRAPVWVKFPNLPLCCWSPSCLSKIASVLGKPIQCDHMTSSLSRLSYARVLVELDLREDLQHSVAVSLPSGPTLNQRVVYEALPKFCNFCNVLGHTRLLCPKVAVSPPPEGTSSVASKGSDFQRLGPQIPPSGVSGHGQPPPVQGPPKDSSIAAIVEPEQAPCNDASAGWTVVEPRRKHKKHIITPAKGKGVFAVAAGSAMSHRGYVPSVCVGVVNSTSAGTVVNAGVELGATSPMAHSILREDNLVTTPAETTTSVDIPLLGEPVNDNRKLLFQKNHVGSRRVPPSPAPP